MLTEQIKYLIENKFLNLDTISVDGTKIKSVAIKYSSVYRGSVGYHERNVEEKLAELIIDANKELSSIKDKNDESNGQQSKGENKKYVPQISFDDILMIVTWLP